MHLSYEGKERKELWSYAKEHSLIGVSHPFITEDWKIDRDYSKKAVPFTWYKQFEMFCKKMETGNIVLVLKGVDSLLGIAEIVEPSYCFDGSISGDNCEPFFDHIRKVKWHRTYSYDEPLKLAEPIKGFVNILSVVKPETRRWQVLGNVTV